MVGLCSSRVVCGFGVASCHTVLCLAEGVVRATTFILACTVQSCLTTCLPHPSLPHALMGVLLLHPPFPGAAGARPPRRGAWPIADRFFVCLLVALWSMHAVLGL